VFFFLRIDGDAACCNRIVKDKQHKAHVTTL